jgi:demethylmenaquinone methyltransferase/2-methoxy-6-polyprenyl-1,4-benzoquinol methylase
MSERTLPVPDAPDNPSPQTVSFGFEDVSPAEKTARVRGVFRSVADSYDLMNDLMSAGVHRVWKANMIARLNPQPGQALIDCAGGTGDISRAFLAAAAKVQARRGGPPATAIVSDINEAMLGAGRRKGGEGLTWVVGDAQQLPFPDRSADVVTISFGIRNVTDIPRALKDMRRVLRPGGKFACLEFSRPTSGALAAAYDSFSFNVIPRLGRAVAGDADSYRYLVESIRRFPDQRRFAGMLSEAGFGRVSVTNYSGGIAALHVGWAV